METKYLFLFPMCTKHPLKVMLMLWISLRKENKILRKMIYYIQFYYEKELNIIKIS